MKHFFRLTIVFLASFLASSNAFAQTDSENMKAVIRQEISSSLPSLLSEKEQTDNEVGGKNDQALFDKYFGAGIVANFDFRKGGARVSRAHVVNGIVRVDETNQAQVGFMLEAHKFVSSTQTGNSWSVNGPFIGIVLREANIDTAILGWMWGFRQPKSTQTLNVGFGLSVSPQAQVLGSGITEGQALPTGETEVRYQLLTKYGLSIVTSFGF